MGCDGIWNVMSSQHAVGVVRRGLWRHDDPEQCARDLVKEALRLNTYDNLTVILVCFLLHEHRDVLPPPHRKLPWCIFEVQAFLFPSKLNLLNLVQDRKVEDIVFTSNIKKQMNSRIVKNSKIFFFKENFKKKNHPIYHELAKQRG